MFNSEHNLHPDITKTRTTMAQWWSNQAPTTTKDRAEYTANAEHSTKRRDGGEPEQPLAQRATANRIP